MWQYDTKCQIFPILNTCNSHPKVNTTKLELPLHPCRYMHNSLSNPASKTNQWRRFLHGGKGINKCLINKHLAQTYTLLLGSWTWSCFWSTYLASCCLITRVIYKVTFMLFKLYLYTRWWKEDLISGKFHLVYKVLIVILFLCTFRCETEGGIHHPSARRRWPDDCGNADEKHCQSSQECPPVSPTEDPHGCCVLIGSRPHPSNSDTFHRRAHSPPSQHYRYYLFIFFTWSNLPCSPCTWTGKMIALWISFCWCR